MGSLQEGISPASARSVVSLAVWLGIVFAAAAIGSVGTSSSVSTWYQTIRKPVFTPPGWVFGPVWTALYVMMAAAAWVVWSKCGFAPTGRMPLALFGVQLVLNACWSLLFFGLQNPGLALVEIVVLWSAVLGTTILFWRVAPTAGWLMAPYLLWGSFACVLNASIWWMNR